MAFILRKSRGSVMKALGGMEERLFTEQRKVRILKKESFTLESHIEEQKQEFHDIGVEQTKRLLDMEDPQEEKSKLVGENKELTREVLEKQVALKGEIERKKELPKTIQKAVLKENKRLILSSAKVVELDEQIGKLKRTKTEIQDFIYREAEVLERYPIEKEELDKIIQNTQKLDIEFAEKKEWMKTRTKELDAYKEILTEHSGKLTSRVHMVKEITELLNQKMNRENILIRLELPVDKNEIPF